MKRVLITGGAGFIGSHTTDLLIKNGYEVIIYDNLSSKTHNGKWPDYINIKAEKIKGDIQDRELLNMALSKCNYVIHLAAEMDLNPDFNKFMNINVGGTALIYELILKNGYDINKVIIASSQFVYGEGIWDCNHHGLFEANTRSINQMMAREWDQRCPKCLQPAIYTKCTENNFNPPNHYALSKFFQEEIGIKLGKLYKIPTTSLRYSIVHGPRQSLKNTYSGALRNFAIRIDLGLELATFEDNKSQRDFISVHDIADANKFILENNESDYEIYNVGSGESWSIIKLAQVLSELMKKPYKFSGLVEFRVGDIRNAVSSIDKIKKLGWQPKHNEKDTLKEYVDWFYTQNYSEKDYKKTQKLLRENNIIREALC